MIGQWIHIHGKFTLKSNFQHFMKSHFPSVLCCEFSLMPNSIQFSNFTWNHTEIDKFFTQNREKWWKLSFSDFSFHANGKKWNYFHTRFTELLVAKHPHREPFRVWYTLFSIIWRYELLESFLKPGLINRF